MVKGGTILHDPDLRRLRAKQILALKISKGMTNVALAKHFNISPYTVARALNYAKRAGLVAEAEDQVLESLVPLAIQRFKTAISVENDTNAALEVLKGTNILKKAGAQEKETSGGGDSLTQYIFQLRGGEDDETGTQKLLAERSIEEGQLIAPESIPQAEGAARGEDHLSEREREVDLTDE